MDTHARFALLHGYLLDPTQILRLIRSQVYVQAQTIDLKQFLTCSLTQYWNMVSLQECVVIGEVKTGMFLF